MKWETLLTSLFVTSQPLVWWAWWNLNLAQDSSSNKLQSPAQPRSHKKPKWLTQFNSKKQCLQLKAPTTQEKQDRPDNQCNLTQPQQIQLSRIIQMETKEEEDLLRKRRSRHRLQITIWSGSAYPRHLTPLNNPKTVEHSHRKQVARRNNHHHSWKTHLHLITHRPKLQRRQV